VDEVEIKEAFSYNLTPAAKREVKKIIYQNFDVFVLAWNEFFNK
jgi:hypothetical protein